MAEPPVFRSIDLSPGASSMPPRPPQTQGSHSNVVHPRPRHLTPALGARGLPFRGRGLPLPFRGRGGAGLQSAGRSRGVGRGRGGRRGGASRGRDGRKRSGRSVELQESELEPAYSPAVQAYLDQRAAESRPKPVPFTPAIINVETMSELRPALASGAPGLCKDVEARVTQLSGDRTGERKQAEDLATRLLAGEPVTFRDESEQEHVLRVAQEMAVPPPSGQEVVAGADQASTKYEGETVGFQPVGLDGRTALLEMCVRGTYEGPEGSQTKMGGSSGKRGKGSKDGMDGDGVLQAIHRVTRLNSTYRPREEQEVMDRVRNFLPKPKPAATARARR